MISIVKFDRKIPDFTKLFPSKKNKVKNRKVKKNSK